MQHISDILKPMKEELIIKREIARCKRLLEALKELERREANAKNQ
ncbi:MAG: hypothetical protein HPY66_1699 [Firmicutes bacterium]|nr:hypothetical protein [Bacillota bacterium]